MTTEEVKNILKHHYDRLSVCVALSYVNLSDEETEVLILRYIRQLSQEVTAEKMNPPISKDKVYRVQQEALNKTSKMWSKLRIAKILIDSIDSDTNF